MNILDAIKSSVVSQFTNEITVGSIIMSLVVAFLISIFVIFVYRKTFSGIVYNKNICLTFVLLAMVTSMIILTINSNLALSLGMVGALSIVRFRTAIKEPMDTAFMFWSITVGIMCGAGLYVVVVVGSILLGLLFYIMFSFSAKAKSKYLLVVTYHEQVESEVSHIISKINKKNLKSESTTPIQNGFVIEKTYEVQFSNEPTELIKALQAINGVKNVNLVSYQSDFGF